MFAINKFRGMFPKVSPLLLSPGLASHALDCGFRHGKLTPLRRPLPVQTTTTDKKGIAVFPSGERVLFDKPVQSVFVGDRIIFTHEGQVGPQFVEKDSVETFYRLGMPRPTAAPTVEFAEGGDEQGAVERATRFRYAYINTRGDEGDLSDWSDSIDLGPNDVVDLTVAAFPTGDGWDERASTVTQVYVSGDGAGIFPIDHNHADDGAPPEGKLRVNLARPRGFPPESFTGLTIPPTGLSNIQEHPDGFWVGRDGNTIRMSQIGDSSRWPAEYSYTYPRGELVGHSVHVDHVYVFPEGDRPLVMFMSHPARPQIVQTTVPWPCVSEGSIVNTGFGVFYSCQAGIVALNGVNGQLITEKHFDRFSFRPYSPDEIRGYELDGSYHAYGNGRPFVLDIHSVDDGFDLAEMSVSPSDVARVGERVLGVDQGTVYDYEVSDNSVAYTWESGLFRLPQPVTMGAFQVRADYRAREVVDTLGGIGHQAVGLEPVGFPETEARTVSVRPRVGFEMIDENDDVIYGPVFVNANHSFPLALGFKVDTFKFRVSADVQVDSVAVASTQRDLGLELS